MQEIRIGYSPCPNDTFIFDALTHGRIDTNGVLFSEVLADVEALNRMAGSGELEVTKLSFHAYMHLLDKYTLLHSGAALGNNCGPMLIAKQAFALNELKHKRIAIPGKMTTANFLLDFALPEAENRIEMIFSDVEDAVLNGEVDAGLIIHENRFTYQDKGLVSLIDLGEYWESHTGHPIPLGGIAVRRDLDLDLQQQISEWVRQSVEYAFEHPEESLPYIRLHAQEMDPEVMKKHIDLYVNDYSVDLGAKGRQAVLYMYRSMVGQGRIAESIEPIFVNL
jgi:1,4-dihydroxy-6-naphthoate synthase